MRSAARNYPSYPSASYGSYGMGPVGSYGMYGWGPGSYGLRSGSYGMGSGSYGPVGFRADSYGSSESPGAVVPSSSSYGVVAEEPCEYQAGQNGSPGQYGSLLSSVIPTSLAGYIPNRGKINVVKQIIHKPFITEFQEIVHKPVVTEMQEIVNKPVVSEVEQIVHRPLYIEHIGLGPTYHGYQKHIVKKPMYEKPNKNYVHKPAIHAGTIHLADEYEHAVDNPQEEPCEYGTPESAYGYSAAYSPNVHYGPVATSYTPYSAPHKYPVASAVPSAPASYRSVSFGYPSILRSSDVRADEQLKTAVVNVVETPLPKAAESIVYDKISPYEQHSNDINQRYYSNIQFPAQFSGIDRQLQQQERSSEDPPAFRIDVDAIDKKLEKNPEVRRQLIQMITESMYMDDRTTHTNKKQEIKL